MSPRLLWIGDNQHPEFHDAWSWANQTLDCQHRPSIDEAVAQPVASIQRVVLARSSRDPFIESTFNALLRQYPIAKFATLLGSLCEGELRTGTPWPICQRIYWHRWAEQGVRWCGEESGEPIIPRPIASEMSAGTIAIVSRSRWICAGLAESLRQQKIPCIAIATQQLSIAGPYSHLLWDDSVLASADDWSALAPQAAAHAGNAQHHWLASGPRIETWQSLQAVGFASLHSKPLDLNSIIDSLVSRSGSC